MPFSMEPSRPKNPSAPPEAAFEPVNGLLDFHRLGMIALRRLWLPLLFISLGVGAGFYYLSKSPKLYVGVAVVQVEQEPREMMKFQDAHGDQDYRSPDVVKTFEQVLSNGSLLLAVVRANGLDHDPSFAPPKPGGAPYTDSELIERMSAKVAVEIRRGTRLIDIRVEDRDPVVAAKLARSLVDEYFRQEIQQKLDLSRGAGEFLAGEEKRLKAKLDESERALAQYRTDNQAVSVEDKQNIVVEKLRGLNVRVTEAKGKRLALEADIARIKGAGATPDPAMLLQMASIAEVPSVADLRRQINDKEGEFAAIKERYKFKHIRYIEAQSNLQKLREALGSEVVKAAGVINLTYQAARETETKLQGALHEQEQAALDLDRVAIPYNALQRQTQTDRALYDSVLTRMKETRVGQGTALNDLRVVQAPTVPFHPSKPSRLKILLAGALVGGFAGVVLAFVLELFNHTLQTVDQAEGILGLPLLAAVPELKKQRRADSGVALVGADDTPQREAFRTLRTTLAAGSQDGETRSFLFTSAVPNEGKSFCAANFAATLAKQGCHTLLIAADLRRVADFPLAEDLKDKPGLGDCLAHGLPLARAVHPTSVQNLFICGAGERSGEPAGLLAGARFQEVLREALGVFDRVVVDTPPINAVSDALLMASHVAAVCVVARACSTPINAVLRACRTLARAGVTPAGFVLNRLPMSFGAKGAYYYYGEEYHDAERTQAGAIKR